MSLPLVGGALHQSVVDIWQPSLNDYNLQKLDTALSGIELPAAYLSVKHICCMLELSVFSIYMDHKPLVYGFKTKPDRHCQREIPHIDFISRYFTDIQHIKESANTVADVACSRVYRSSADNGRSGKQQRT